jgi:SAM-dependent methyltransferase
MSKFGGYEDQAFVAEFYDHNPAYAARPDVGFWLSLAGTAGGPILELGCGTGRVLIPIAAAGHTVVGLDLSEYMLARCREKLAAQPAEVQERARLVQASMTGFDLAQSFALVIVPFRGFQHLVPVAEQLACLRCANRHLVGGGRIVLDLFQVNLRYITTPEALEEREDLNTMLPDGRRLRRTHRVAGWHRAEQYNDVEMIHYVTHPDGREERLVQAFPFRYFFRYEVEHLLARCGFEVVDVFGGYDRSPLADGSPEMLAMAEKVRDLGEA